MTQQVSPAVGADAAGLPTLAVGQAARPGRAKTVDVAPVVPTVWGAIPASATARAWLALNEFVEHARHTYALPAHVIPPYWHRHALLVEHLLALRGHYLAKHAAAGSGPFEFLTGLSEWEARMRTLVAQIGTRIDSDRPYNLARWPGEPANHDSPPPVNLQDRDADFRAYANWDIARRYRAEHGEYQDSETP